MKRTRFQRERKRKSSLKRIVFGGLFFCLLAGLVYFLIWSPVFWIEKIEVKGNKSVPFSEIKNIVQKDLEEKLWQLVPQKSIALVPDDKIKEDVFNSFSEIKKVVVNKKLPHWRALASLTKMAGAGLELIIEERESIGIWCQVEEVIKESQPAEETEESEVLTESKIKKCFYLDEEGVVFKESPLISGSRVLNIFSSTEESVDLRSEVVSSETIDFILKVNEELPEKKTVAGPSWQIVDFKLISPEDLRVRTSRGCQIYFNPAYSVDWQLRALELVLEEEIKENWPALEYIDLRIEGRVYYK